jgi:nucleoside-diphosphate-sugar epimerase
MLIFFTGFPGFLGSAVLPRVLRRTPSSRALCLVQPRFAALARARADALVASDPTLRDRIGILEGDIRERGLAADAVTQVGAAAVEFYHLAAVYDLTVRRDVAYQANVIGTRHVLEFASRCQGLRRVHYVSTCYVSGRLPGVFRETDLACGQSFNNWYEETKYLAELEVSAGIARGLPATIYRPSIIVGDSGSGEAQKFDGPYFAMQLIARQRSLALVPVMGDVARTTFNIVPRDFVVEAIDWLSALDRSVGATYHLADPDPPTIAALLDAIGAAAGRRVVRVPVPLRVARATLASIPFARRLLGIPPQALDYFVHPTTYDTTNATRDLEGSGVAVPRFSSYVGRLLAFMREHPEIGSAPMA